MKWYNKNKNNQIKKRGGGSVCVEMINFSNFMKWGIGHVEKQQINQPL